MACSAAGASIGTLAPADPPSASGRGDNGSESPPILWECWYIEAMAYTAGDYLIQTRMTAISGLPQDTVVNDFAVKFDADPGDLDLAEAMGAVGDFFRLGATVNDRVGSYISEWIDRAATHSIAAYQIVAGSIGSPRMEIDWLGPVTSGSSTSMPTELAGCLSFHGDLTGLVEESGATRPKARRRGRLFIGPLNGLAIDEHLADARLASLFTLALRANANVMGDHLETLSASWAVWSRANATLYPVVGGWTDNAPDIQRRRGVSPTARTVFTR